MNDFTQAAELMKRGQTALSPFEAAAEEMKRRTASSVGMALTYDERNPDAAAKSLNVGKELGVSPLIVDAEPEAYDARLRMKRAADALRDAPKTAAWLSDMGNGVLAKDDIDNLAWFERGLRDFAIIGGQDNFPASVGRAIGRGAGRVSVLPDTMRKDVAASRIADVGRTFDEIVAEELAQVGGERAPAHMRAQAIEAARFRHDAAKGLTQKDVDALVKSGAEALRAAREKMDAIAGVKMSGSATRFRDESLAASENTLMGVLGAFAQDPIGGASFVAETAAEFIPALAAAAAVTVTTRSPAAGAVAMGGSSFLIENSSSAMEFLAEKGVDLSTPEAAAAVIQNAELMQEARDRGLTRGLIIGIMDTLSGGVAGQTLAKSPVGDMIAQGVAQMLFGGGGEAMAQIEAGQEVSWADIVIEGLAELATAPIEVLGVGGRKLLAGSVRQAKSGKTAARLTEAEAQAMASKLRERAPEKFKEALDAQGLGDQAVYVPADALREYFQAKDVQFDDEMMRAWGIDPLTFEEAASAGTDVGIPMSNYATYIAGSEDAKWFAENATSDPEEMSLAMAKAFNESVQDIMQEAFDASERARLADEELRAADVQIYDQMFSQLRAAGRSPDVAKNEASVWAAFWRTMGERYGDDPLSLARSMGVDVRGPQSEAFRRRDTLDIALNTLRTRGDKALKPKGLSLAEFVKARGGIQDTGGDVASMDPPKGIVAETAQEARARTSQPALDGVPSQGKGVTLDEMGRMAAEAGYFPDLLGEVNLGTNKGEATGFAARLLQALGDDLAGRKVFAEGEGPDAALTALSEALSERGIDIATATNDEIAAALEAANDPRILYQPAYHGSPHIFDRFSTDFMGTGEGAQAFGWGLYFAGRKGVAKYYRDKLTAGSKVVGPHGYSISEVDEADFFSQLKKMLDRGEPLNLKPEDADKFASDFMGMAIDGEIDGINATAANDSLIGQAFKKFKDGMIEDGWVFREKGNGRLYKVDIPEDGDLLAWDAPLSEQPEKVRDAIMSVVESLTPKGAGKIARIIGTNGADKADFTAKRWKEKPWDTMTGEEIYQQISVRLVGEVPDAGWTQIGGTNKGGDRAASLALRDAGIPGHRFLDGGSRGQGEGSYNYVIYDDSAVSVLEFEQGKRGSIVLPSGGLGNGQTVINLFEGADLSTFLHESSHFFLEAFASLASDPAAPQQMRDDLATIREWLGNDGGPLTVEQHEKFARGGEAYFMEGKAPSLALADAFSRFKAWLTRIYRSIAGLNVKITPEIREVMGRMLATDAEIAEMRAEMEMRPLFAEAPTGMSDGDFTTYQRMARRATESAEQALLEKTMAKVRREKQAWYKDEKRAVRAEVATEFDRQPRYRLIDMLANQIWNGLDEDGEARTVPDVQIDRKMLVEQFGEGVLPEISRTRLGGKRAIYGDNGSSPQEVAEFFGFGSAVEMIEVLQNTPKKQDAIAEEVERRMMERHGDPLNDGSIEEEALAAIHNEQQANLTISEARHMAKQLGRPTRTMAAKFYRLRARDMIGRMTVRDASRADRFLAAERKAAQTAQAAFARVAKGKGEAALAEALQAKEQQILNGFLYDEARKVAQEVQKGRERMRAYGKKSVREKLEGGYIEQIDAILSDYDFRVRGPGQVARTESLKAFVDRMIADGREGELAIDARLMDEAHRKHYSRLSVDELRGLLDTVANIDHLGRFKQKLIDAAKKRDLDATVGQVVGAMDANLKDRPPNRTETTGEKTRRKGRDYLNLTLNADTLLREMDGFKDLGPAWTALKEDLDGGMARLAERRVEMATELDRIYSVYSTKEKREMSVKRAIPELGGLFSKWDIISIALNTGNDENYARLTNPRTKGGFTPEQVKTALSQMDARDWSMVQAMWDYIDTFWPEIAEKERRNTGVSPKKVDAKLMVDAPSEVRGGYYPIKYDPRLSHRVTENETKDLMDRMRAGSFGKAQTKNGHTKERRQNVALPLRLDLGVAHEHLANVIYDLEIGEPVNNAHRILRDERVRDAFRQKGKQSDYEALELWLQDTAAGDQVRAGFGQAVLRHMRSGFVISRLALNLSTALIQPSGLAQSAVVIGKKPMLKGTLSYLGRMNGWVNDVLEVSSLMRERQKTFQRDIFNVVGELESGPVTGRWSKFHRDVVIPLSFFMMQKVQFYAVDMPTWVAAYEKEIAASGDEKKAWTYADSMVRRAQGSGLMSDRGMMERGTIGRDIRQSEIPRLFTALGSYMFAKGNVAYERTMRTNFKSPAEAFSWAADMALLFTLEAVLYSAVKGFLPDEDEDDAAWLAKETVLSAMSTLPFARDLASVAQGFGGGIYGSILDTAFAKPLVQIGQGDADRAMIKSLVDAGGIFLHLPSSQAKNVINGLLESDGSFRSDPDFMGMLGMSGEGRVTIADYLSQ